MLASVLNSKRAIEVNVAIVRAFHQVRELQYSELRLAAKTASETESQHRQIIQVLDEAQHKITALCSLRETPIALPSPDHRGAGDDRGDLVQGRYNGTAEVIQMAVAKYYGIKIEDLKGSGRTKAVALARQISMYLIREKLHMSFKDIAVFFGRKDHTTILHACRKIEAGIAEDKRIRVAVKSIGTEI